MTTDAAPPTTSTAGEPYPPPAPLAELVKALAAAQGEFPEIKKGKTAEVRTKDGGKYEYSYADIADVLAAVRPVLSRHELAIVQRTATNGSGKLELLTELHHAGGGVLESGVELQASPGSPQQFGASLTYLRRYEVVTLLGIAAEEDTDAQHMEPVRNGNGNGQAPAELPGWARPAGDERLGELGAALVPVMGRTRARRVVASIRTTLGNVPDLAVGTAKLIGENVAEAIAAVGPDGTLEELTARLEQEETDVQAKRDADAAAMAAEAGDTLPDVDPPPDPADPDPAGALETEADQDAAAAAGSLEPDRPVPASIDPPKPEEGETESDLRERFEAAGCICDDPLAPLGQSDQHNENCPIKGHGIGF